jgi:DNA polymerase-3 subunit delta
MPASNSPSASNKDIERLLKEARAGQAKRVYLFAGESFDTRAAAQAMIDELVPESKRAFNLETYDGRTTPISTVLDSLRTPGFFSGSKVIWVRETPLFMSNDKRGDLTESLFGDWEAGREAQAAEKMLTLVALAGWTQAQLEQTNWSSMPAAKVREVFGESLEEQQRQVLDAIRSAAQARDLRVAEYHDDAASLLQFLEGDKAAGDVLLFTSSAADGRKKIVKRIQELGGYVALTVERERSGALSRQSVDELIRRFAQATGKRVDPAAHEQIIRRAGADAAGVASELEKLGCYVGDRQAIREEDVRASFIDMAESWIFDFTAARAGRRLAPALRVLIGLLDQGEPPLRLLAMIAREIRLLLIARESLESALRDRWQRGMSFDSFQSKVAPHIDESTKRAFGNSHPFVLFRRYQDAAGISAAVLRAALVRLSELDLQLKSSVADPSLLMESFVIDWCRGFQSQSAAGARR